MQEMDILLKEAFGELIEQEYQQRPRNLPKHRFSMRFRIKMYRLLRQVGAKSKRLDGGSSMLELYRPVRSKRGLVIILALLLMLLGGTITAAETLVQWLNEIMLEQHGDHVKIFKKETGVMDEELSNGEERFFKYNLAELPEGYRLLEEVYIQRFNEYQITYVNDKGDMMLLRQSGCREGIMGNITSAQQRLEEICIDGFEGYYCQDSDVGNLILSDGNILIELSGSMTIYWQKIYIL